jgi:hypothetical protein
LPQSTQEKGPEVLCVLAVNSRFIELFAEFVENLTCRIVRAHRDGNANLHSLAGVYTVCRGQVRGDHGSFIPPDEFLRLIARGLPAPDDMLPCLRQFRFPMAVARTLLRKP